MNPDHLQNLNAVLKYSDASTVQNLAGQMTFADWVGDHPDADHTKRGVLADAYEELTGDTSGAGLLRDPKQTVASHKNKLVPGVVRHRDVAGEWNEDAHDVLDTIQEKGPDEGLLYALGYDDQEGPLSEEHNTENSPDLHHTSDGYYTLGWGDNNWSLTEHHVIPESKAAGTYYRHGKVS
jgi:hypothetical protein